jgi:hypothetical protein
VPYSDLPLVQELRAMLRQFKGSAKVAPHAADTSRKWLDWPEYLQVRSAACLLSDCLTA